MWFHTSVISFARSRIHVQFPINATIPDIYPHIIHINSYTCIHINSNTTCLYCKHDSNKGAAAKMYTGDCIFRLRNIQYGCSWSCSNGRCSNHILIICLTWCCRKNVSRIHYTRSFNTNASRLVREDVWQFYRAVILLYVCRLRSPHLSLVVCYIFHLLIPLLCKTSFYKDCKRNWKNFVLDVIGHLARRIKL